jgi:dTDP-4-dehydrorhamnose reductase
MSTSASGSPRILVVGGRGMLGQACVDELSRDGRAHVEFTDRRGAAGAHVVDVRQNPARLWQLLQHARYDLIVNAIGVLRAAMTPASSAALQHAVAINAMFPHELALRAAETGSPLVHVSTDAVFPGHGEGPYDEASAPAPADPYGASKWLGEPHTSLALTIRCSIVGRRRDRPGGLIDWFVGQPAGARVTGFTDYRWTPATTTQVASLLGRLVDGELFRRLRSVSPVFHFAPNPPLSKWDLLETLNRVRGAKVRVEPGQHPSGPVDLSLTTRFDEFRQLYPAPRPWPAILSEV